MSDATSGTQLVPGLRPAAGRPRAAVAVTVAAVAVTSVPLVERSLRGTPPAAAAALAGLAALVLAARWTRSGPALRTALVALLVHAQVLVLGLGVWPAPLLVAVLLVAVAGRWWPPLRPVLAWLRPGHRTPDLPWLVLAVVALSAAALVAWALVVRPEVSPLLRTLRETSPLLALAGITGFALANSACEEAVYTGAFLHELRGVLSVPVALAVQSAAFGLMHVEGFPSGLTGVALGAVYGVMLGVVRLRSEGMVAPYLAHVAADVTIGVLAVFVL